MTSRIKGWDNQKEATCNALLFTGFALVFIPTAIWMYRAELALPKGQHSQWISMSLMSVVHSTFAMLYWLRVIALRRGRIRTPLRAEQGIDASGDEDGEGPI